MSIGKYLPKVGDRFIFTPNPAKPDDLSMRWLSHIGGVVEVVYVDNPFSKYSFEIHLVDFLEMEPVGVNAEELSFIVLTQNLEDWL